MSHGTSVEDQDDVADQLEPPQQSNFKNLATQDIENDEVSTVEETPTEEPTAKHYIMRSGRISKPPDRLMYDHAYSQFQAVSENIIEFSMIQTSAIFKAMDHFAFEQY